MYSEEKYLMSEPSVNIPDRKGLIALKGLQLMMLFGFFAIGILLTGGAAMGLHAIPGVSERISLLLSAGIQCLLAFCLPAWLTGKLTTRDSFQWLDLKTLPSAKGLLGVVIVYILALPAMNQIISWNESIHFPDGLHGLEASLRASENAAREVGNNILADMNIWGMLAAVGIVGLLTGFSEEMFFRGGLQTIMTMPGRHTFAIWTSAIIFSAVHFQFFGFFPRVLMGVFFGYLLVWSGSLWLPVFAHALNNSIVVFSVYLLGGTSIPEIDTIGIAQTGHFPWGALTSAAATFIFLRKFRGYFFKSWLRNPVVPLSER